MYTISELKNGMKIASCVMPNTGSVALGVWVGAGGRYEQERYSGISHFFEHIVFKGTKTRSYRQIKESIEGSGGVLNGFTAEEVTCFLAKVLPRHLPVALDVLLDMVLDPLISSRDVERERLVIAEEIKMYFDLPYHLAYDRLVKLLWPGHPLGRNLAGSFASLENIMRTQLNAHKQMFCGVNNLLITACGNVSHEKLVQRVHVFLREHRDALFVSKKEPYLAVSRRQAVSNAVFLRKKTQQTHLCLGLHAPGREDPLRHAVSLLHIVLGANMSSRLFNEVRERKGYAYEIATAVRRFNDCGAFIVHAGVVNDKANAAGVVIIEQLKKICDDVAGKNELRRAKEYFIGQFVMGLEDTAEHMLWMGEAMMTRGKPEYARAILREVKDVSARDVREAARLIFRKSGANLSVIGPLEKKQQETIAALLEGLS